MQLVENHMLYIVDLLRRANLKPTLAPPLQTTTAWWDRYTWHMIVRYWALALASTEGKLALLPKGGRFFGHHPNRPC